MIPIAGSAYTYTYATMGELVAWIIGWDLILEYAVSNMAVSVGFAAHIVDFLDWFGVHPRCALDFAGLSALRPLRPHGKQLYAPGWHFGFNCSRISHRHDPHRGAGARHPRVRADQQHHGAAQDRRHPRLHLWRGALHSIPATGIRFLPTAGPACSPAARSSSSPTSASIPSPPRPRSATVRSAMSPSASSPRWSSARCSISAWPSCSPAWSRGTR